MPVDPDVLRYRIDDIHSAISELKDLVSKSFEELSSHEKYSMRYLIISLVEALVSLCAHISVEKYGRSLTSYRDVIRFTCQRLDVRCLDDLEALVSLRNLPTHRYWTIDDRQVYNSVKRDFKCVEHFLEKVREVFLE